MRKYGLVTTYYCINCSCPSKEELKTRFNYDGDVEDLYINFSSEFDPWHTDEININVYSGRKDLIYSKIFLLKNFIEQHLLNKYEYICHIDYNDTKFCRSYVEMMEKFILSDKEFIISTEKNCWPYLDIVQTWVNYNIENKEFNHINSGAVISKTKKYYEYLSILENICLNVKYNFYDDQGVWQYHHLNNETLNLDTSCEYFFSTAHLDESYYFIHDNKIKTKFNTYPYLIHDNSSFSLNLRDII